MKQKQLSTIIMAMVITAIVVGSGVFLWQKKGTQRTTKQQAVKVQEARPLAACGNLDNSWSLFQNSKTTLSFCYKQAWGTPELYEGSGDRKSYIGEIWYISFSKSRNRGRSLVRYYGPSIIYRSQNYQRTGDSDVPDISFAGMDFSKTESELARLFSNENASVQKLNINGRQVLKVKRDFIDPLSQDRIQSLDYFIPNVAINGKSYNLNFRGSPEQESDLDKLLESMRF